MVKEWSTSSRCTHDTIIQFGQTFMTEKKFIFLNGIFGAGGQVNGKTAFKYVIYNGEFISTASAQLYNNDVRSSFKFYIKK